jgi:hypothetical protein
MKKIVLAGLLLIAASRLFAQQTATDSIKQTVNTMFAAMLKGDSALMRSTFDKDMILQGVAEDKTGKATISTDKVNDFLKVIGTPHAMVYDERIVYDAIKIDGDLAVVWAPYKFYLGGKFHHCGIDVFHLMRTPNGWKIIYIVDTRRAGNCPD